MPARKLELRKPKTKLGKPKTRKPNSKSRSKWKTHRVWFFDESTVLYMTKAGKIGIDSRKIRPDIYDENILFGKTVSGPSKELYVKGTKKQRERKRRPFAESAFEVRELIKIRNSNIKLLERKVSAKLKQITLREINKAELWLNMPEHFHFVPKEFDSLLKEFDLIANPEVLNERMSFLIERKAEFYGIPFELLPKYLRIKSH